MKQVITISADGAVSGLQRKKGQGVDLRQMGNAQIERVSEIKFHEGRQRWYVHVIAGPMKGITLTVGHWTVEVNRDAFPAGSEPGGDANLYFQDYDDAVRAEVAWLDALRLQGVF